MQKEVVVGEDGAAGNGASSAGGVAAESSESIGATRADRLGGCSAGRWARDGKWRRVRGCAWVGALRSSRADLLLKGTESSQVGVVLRAKTLLVARNTLVARECSRCKFNIVPSNKPEAGSDRGGARRCLTAGGCPSAEMRYWTVRSPRWEMHWSAQNSSVEDWARQKAFDDYLHCLAAMVLSGRKKRLLRFYNYNNSDELFLDCVQLEKACFFHTLDK